MNKFLLLLAVVLLASACGKDDFVNPEDTGFGRLSKGNGVWTLTSFEYVSFDNSGNATVDSVITNNGQFIFFRKSIYAGGAVVSYNAVAIEQLGVGSISYEVWSEDKRIIFHTPGSSFDEAYVYTIKENKPKKQVWEVINPDGSGKRVLTLEYCRSCEPLYPGSSFSETGL